MNIVFLGLGTNLGNREKNLNDAFTGIREQIGKVLEASSVYETEPWGFQSESKFLNIVIKVETGLSPSMLLEAILLIELRLGRVRSGNQFSSRIIDIDILLYEDQVIDKSELKIPHPKLHERKFVLVPLVEIEPDLVHPVLKKTMASLLESCEDKSEVRKIR
ncbi:MAG TPA: 2-amino-4-hydroxy-6-hydroxymethyldihydropteridine diphosphokinase [Bacteroidales bacterium]